MKQMRLLIFDLKQEDMVDNWFFKGLLKSFYCLIVILVHICLEKRKSLYRQTKESRTIILRFDEQRFITSRRLTLMFPLVFLLVLRE